MQNTGLVPLANCAIYLTTVAVFTVMGQMAQLLVLDFGTVAEQ